MSKIFSVTALIVAISAMSAADAFAQRGADRLGILKPHYGSSGGMSRSNYGFSQRAPMYSSRPASPIYAQPAPENAYRSFSLEPIGIRPGDTVAVRRENARLMLGPNVVGTAPAGLTFKVTKVVNGWLGAVVEINGQQHKGWIWNRDVQAADDVPPAPPAGA
jgi:hypothetical protein